MFLVAIGCFPAGLVPGLATSSEWKAWTKASGKRTSHVHSTPFRAALGDAVLPTGLL